MIPPNYIPSDPSRESERTKAARALVVECIGSDSSDMPAPGVIAGGMTMDEANRRAWLRRPGESSTIPAGFENRRGEVELTYSGIDQRISAIYTPDHDEPNRLRDHDRSPSP